MTQDSQLAPEDAAPAPTLCLDGPQFIAGEEGMGPWCKGACEGSTKGAQIQHPQATKRSDVCPGLGLSSVPAQGPSTVQVVAGSPVEKAHFRQGLAPNTQAQAGQADAGHQDSQEGPWCEDRASEDGHLENHSMGTLGL